MIPDFSKATVENFLDEPWLSRVNTILNLLESTDPRIQQCMIQYFNGIAQRKIEGCVRQYGDNDVKNFEMPALPDWRNLDIAKIKAAVLNRMIVTQSMMECSKTLPDDNQLQDSMNCVKDARLSNRGSFCAPRDQCLKSKVTDELCSTRYEKVKTAACACFSAEIQQFKGAPGQVKNFNDLKDTLLQGLEKEYKKCYDRNNLPYPVARVEAAKTATKQAVADILFGGLPPRVRLLLRILGESVREVTGSGRRLFCENCQDNQTRGSGIAEAQQLRQLATESSVTSATPFFAQQQAPFFSQFVNSGGR
uniref:Uncharacterized protein n=1 Tax=Romanomermis culicivorax TaxID=13658 RepID=A0A915KV97_ROMCU